jgi:hypothetical protein
VSWVRKVNQPIPGSWMLTGEGPRRADCPEGCSAWEAPSRAEADAERDHLAMSRAPITAAVGGGGWRTPGTGGER